MITNTKAKIHWFDAKSGDGMVKLQDGRLVTFWCGTVADLTHGETVPIILYEDTTFIQAEIDTAKM